MLPFNQGALDSLCGIYSVVNADRILNMTPKEGSKELFSEIIHFLSRKRWLSSILTEGMMLKHVSAILEQVMGSRIPLQEMPFRGVATPDLDAFWAALSTFLDGQNRRVVLLATNGLYDHWTVIQSLTDNQINLFDSYRLRKLPRAYCTTSGVKGRRQHHLLPAQTFFLSAGA
ncbi:MAG: hypothetical protein ACM3O7_01550 [Acidobacteriota bacterium]